MLRCGDPWKRQGVWTPCKKLIRPLTVMLHNKGKIQNWNIYFIWCNFHTNVSKQAFKRKRSGLAQAESGKY